MDAICQVQVKAKWLFPDVLRRGIQVLRDKHPQLEEAALDVAFRQVGISIPFEKKNLQDVVRGYDFLQLTHFSDGTFRVEPI